MPTYEYECRECNHQFESFQWMDDRASPRKRHVQRVVKNPWQDISQYRELHLDEDDYNQSIDRPHNVNGFRDMMERVANGAGVKNTKYEKRLRDKHLT